MPKGETFILFNWSVHCWRQQASPP